MKVIRADAMGFCFGVRDALAVTETIADPQTVTIHGELVHNRQILEQLSERGFRMTPEGAHVEIPETADVLITAHGLSDSERERLERAGKRLIDTTCPLVRQAHRAAVALRDDGRHLLVIGRPGHVEVRGLIGDLESYDVIGSVEDVREYETLRLGVVCQTTVSPRTATAIRTAIRKHNPRADIRFVDTICQPTRDRQQALERLLPHVDVMVIVGGRNSNNTKQLVCRCRERNVPAHHIQATGDIDPGWFTNCHVAGLSAGTSTPDETIRQVYETLCQLDNNRRQADAVCMDAP